MLAANIPALSWRLLVVRVGPHEVGSFPYVLTLGLTRVTLALRRWIVRAGWLVRAVVWEHADEPHLESVMQPRSPDAVLRLRSDPRVGRPKAFRTGSFLSGDASQTLVGQTQSR